MNTSHSPYFLPPTRFSKPFFCNFAIMNFTPSSVILPSAFAASTLVALGLSLKYSNTFFWVVSKFFWVAISFFWGSIDILKLPLLGSSFSLLGSRGSEHFLCYTSSLRLYGWGRLFYCHSHGY